MPRLDDIAGTHIEEPEREAKLLAILKIWLIFNEELKNTNYKENPTFWGRLSWSNRDEILVASEKDIEKLKRLNSTIHPEVDTGLPTPKKRRISAEFMVQPPNPAPSNPSISPIRLKLKSMPASPYPRSFCQPQELSPNTRARAQKLPTLATDTKTVSAEITPETFKENKNRKRKKSRKEFNGLSANQLACYEGTHQGLTLELLHGLGHAFGGKFKRKNNIFVGTRDDNTKMMHFDESAKELLQQGQTIQINASCSLQEKSDGSGYTDQAKQIHLGYQSNTGAGFSSTINANSQDRPTVKAHKLIKDAIVDVCSKKENLSSQENPFLFFNPQEQKADCIELLADDMDFDNFNGIIDVKSLTKEESPKRKPNLTPLPPSISF